MKNRTGWMGTLILGASLMYFLDPDRGKRRRALIRDKTKKFGGQLDRTVSKTARDLANRTHGLTVMAETLFRREAPLDDVLEARVRSKLGRLVSHPGSVGVTVRNGVVTLSGHVIAGEANPLRHAVARIAGVSRVESHIQSHEQSDHFPGLQGGVSRRPGRFELLQTNWSPAARFLTGMAGAGLAIYGARKHGMRGVAMNLFGSGLLARSISNMEMKQLLGGSTNRKLPEMSKSAHAASAQ